MWNPKRLRKEEEESKIGIFARLKAAWEGTRELVATRAEIFREEISEKKSLLGRGAIGLGIALVLGWLAILLFTAFVAVLLAQLLGSAWAGLLVAFGLYGIGAGAAGFLGWKAFSNLRPFQFPATKNGLREDWSAIRESLRPVPPVSDEGENLEDRFRAGSE